jgi:hypothetical protein
MRVRASLAGIAAAATVGLLGVLPAVAATEIGQVGPNSGCGANSGRVQQSVSSGADYAVPFDGVITSFTTHGPAGFQTKLLVLQPLSPGAYLVVGKSEYGTYASTGLQTFPAVVPAQAGTVIGIYGVVCNTAIGGAGDVFRNFAGPEPALGNSQTFPNATSASRVILSATLEPDCDNDGLGDETQDSDLVTCDATAPTVAITRGPKNKTKKKKATFEFTGSDARAVASFQCSLDGASFAACSSPHTVKVNKGRHSFQVRAVDQNGNVGASVSDEWKVKKKKK